MDEARNEEEAALRRTLHRSWLALRVVLVVLLWLPQPFLLLGVVFGAIPLPDFFGFLPGGAFVVLVGAALVLLSVLICTVGASRGVALKSGIALAAVVAVLLANHFWGAAQFVDSLAYDEQTANELAAAGNLEGDMADYRPFTGSAVARLDEPSTLKFAPGEQLPRVDSATALLPMAAAFVTATYPEEEVTVQWGAGQAAAPGLYDADGLRHDAVFQYNNSSAGFMELAECRTDVFFGTKADEYQAQDARDMGVEFDYTPIGREGFVFLVNAGNPVDSLTVEQVRGIYSGRITNWREVGGYDAPILAYQRNANSGSQSMMERFMAQDELSDPPAELRSGSMGGLVRSVASYDNGRDAIGYSFRYYATDLVGDYDVKLLSIEGVPPTAENIASEAYPITGEFYAVTRAGDEQQNLRRLIDWIRGPQGQELVEKSGYAPLS